MDAIVMSEMEDSWKSTKGSRPGLDMSVALDLRSGIEDEVGEPIFTD